MNISRGDRVRQQAQHSTSMPDIPLELINEIIGHVEEQGEGLKACTTVAKAWAALAKPLLHQKLSIVHPLEELEGFIKKIAPWIKHLYVRLNTTSIKSDVGEDIFKTIAEKSNLEHFELDCDVLDEDEVVAETWLYQLLFQPTLTTLDIEGIPMRNDVLTCHPKLKSLRISDDCWSMRGQHHQAVYPAGRYILEPAMSSSAEHGAIINMEANVTEHEEDVGQLLEHRGHTITVLKL